VVPHPGFRVDGFADGTEDAEGAEVMSIGPFLAEADEGTDGGRGGIEDVDLEFFDDLPEATGVGEGGDTFEHEGRGAVAEGP
jgi:hypothetical protein